MAAIHIDPPKTSSRLNQHITSRQNARVKEAAKLRDRRAREQQGRFLIDGAREMGRALAAGIEIVEAFVCEPLASGGEARATARTAGGRRRQTWRR